MSSLFYVSPHYLGSNQASLLPTWSFLVRRFVNGRAGGNPNLTLVRKLLQVNLEDVKVVDQGDFLVAGPGTDGDVDQLQLAFVERGSRSVARKGETVGHLGHDSAADFFPWKS